MLGVNYFLFNQSKMKAIEFKRVEFGNLKEIKEDIKIETPKENIW